MTTETGPNWRGILAGGILATVAGVSFLLPEHLSVPSVSADAMPDRMSVLGVVRDFRSAHPDFNVTPDQGYGHYVGMVVRRLGADRRPVFVGDGSAGALDDFTEPVLVDFGHTSSSEVYAPAAAGPAAVTLMTDGYDAQVAAAVTFPAGGTVESITAYVDCSGDETGYALYADAAGEPGALLAATAFPAPGSGLQWLKIDLPLTTVNAGTYWLALAQDSSSERYQVRSDLAGQTRRNTHDAEEEGFQANWSGTVTNRFNPISIYATMIDGSTHGYAEANSSFADEYQIATQVTLPEDCTLIGLTAYVGQIQDDLRYAVYSDSGGEPGTLVVESAKEQTGSPMQWIALEMPATELTAGTYWLALAMDDVGQAFGYEPSGGTTVYAPHDAADNGFLSAWSGTATTTTERLAIFGTYETMAGTFHFVLGGEGGGFKVNTEWYDQNGMPIPPHLVGTEDPTQIDFDVDEQEVVPGESFAMKATVLGAAIQNGAKGYHLPVTVQIDVGGTVHEPFGPFTNMVTGNVNDEQAVTGEANDGPYKFIFPGVLAGGTAINVTGRSWKMLDADVSGTNTSNWKAHKTAGTVDGGAQIKVLRDGDPIPGVAGLYDQDSISDYVSDYVDVNAGLMSLDKNEVIYLFELGTAGTAYRADFQDLVVLVELADSEAALGEDSSDVAGTAGALSTGGVTSAGTFDEWYRDILGVNLSAPYTLTLSHLGGGIYEYSTDAFYPIDERLFGSGPDGRNHFFTYQFEARFVYEEGAGQFYEFQGSDDAWLFVDGRLVLDLGGVLAGTSQRADLDRLGLTDGETYRASFFYARRQSLDGAFRLRTSVPLTRNNSVMFSGIAD